MSTLISLLQEYGLFIVFAVVLVQQFGLPIPAFPILIVSGALVVDGDGSWPAVLALSVAACLISDYFWFRAGRHYGKRILKLLCRISLSPDYCVSQTEDSFSRWGPKGLIVAKFVPGFSTIAPPLAGAMGTGDATFLGFSVLGALLWSGTGIALGAYFHTSVDEVLETLGTMGTTALIVLVCLLALFVCFKYVERKRFQRKMQGERISVDALRKLVDDGLEPVLVDARSATAQTLDPAAPGALLFSGGEPSKAIGALSKDRHIVVYCSCPNDVTAAHVAQQLHAHGYHRAKPLQGGLDAWNAAFRPQGAAVNAAA
ncbi:VTT domain-containing protein [Janthinobacterium sp. CG3]|uniref:VTT domain-containing protein n=1 Tax=Janthinobacterium sp. CG3 TaxID=1075768 RepID=UPI0004756D15|nr:VTT domain-containing protein [Janthinobacterium sp. CG3]